MAENENGLGEISKIESKTLKRGDVVLVSQAAHQQNLLRIAYQFLGYTGSDNPQKPSDICYPEDAAAVITDVFKKVPSESDFVPKEGVRKSMEIIKGSFGTVVGNAGVNLINAKNILQVIEDMPDYRELKVNEVIGEGATGVVVRMHDDKLYKIMFPGDTADRATHLDRIREKVKSLPKDIRDSIALPISFYEAKYNGDEETIIAEIPEGRGCRFADWQPKSIREYGAVFSKIAEVVTALHRVGVINVDSGDLMIDTPKLDEYLKDPKKFTGSFVKFIDLDESLIVSLTDACDIIYPHYMQKGNGFSGKPRLWNPLIIVRDWDRLLPKNIAMLVDMENFMTQAFNKLAGLGDNGQVAKVPYLEGGCYFDLHEPSVLTGYVTAAYNFIKYKHYPLISKEEFTECVSRRFVGVEYENAESVYDLFKSFFNKYHSETQIFVNRLGENEMALRQQRLNGVQSVNRELVPQYMGQNPRSLTRLIDEINNILKREPIQFDFLNPIFGTKIAAFGENSKI
jgi:hypothetical protein